MAIKTARPQLPVLLLVAVLQGCTTPIADSPAAQPPLTMTRVSLEDQLASVVNETFGDEVFFRNRPIVKVTERDGIVLLTGQVRSEEEKARISNAVAFAASGKLRRLSNELRVVQQIDHALVQSDAILADSARAALVQTMAPLPDRIEVVVENACVYLLGRVSRAQGATAAELLSGLEGVAAVRTVFDYKD